MHGQLGGSSPKAKFLHARQTAASSISQCSILSAGIAVSRLYAQKHASRNIQLWKVAASSSISWPEIPQSAYKITAQPPPLLNPKQPVPDTSSIDPAAEHHISQERCSTGSTLLWRSQKQIVENVPLPSSSDFQSSLAQRIVSWWDRATRLSVMGSSVLLAAGMFADMRTNAWIIGQRATCNVASLPAGAVRTEGGYPASS